MGAFGSVILCSVSLGKTSYWFTFTTLSEPVTCNRISYWFITTELVIGFLKHRVVCGWYFEKPQLGE